MTTIRQSRRRFLQASAVAGAALFTPRLVRPLPAQTPAEPDLGGLRDKIEHIVVIFQENRSFDHYFDAYRPANGGQVANLLDGEGNIDPRFLGMQKNAAGVAYPYLPVPYNIPGFAGAQCPTCRFT
jgi:phospholipase C